MSAALLVALVAGALQSPLAALKSMHERRLLARFAAADLRRVIDEMLPLAPSQLLVRPTGTPRGDGLFATGTIDAGTFIIDYEGENLSADQVRARFGRLAQGEYLMESGARLHRRGWAARLLPGGFRRKKCYIDAGDPAVSSRARFINHSRRPNCLCQTMDGLAPADGAVAGSLPRAMIFASADIAEGEELTFDYGQRYWRHRGAGEEIP
jgi:hypothetical protein